MASCPRATGCHIEELMSPRSLAQFDDFLYIIGDFNVRGAIDLAGPWDSLHIQCSRQYCAHVGTTFSHSEASRERMQESLVLILHISAAS